MAEETAHVENGLDNFNLDDMNLDGLDLDNPETLAGARQKIMEMIKNGELSEDMIEGLQGMLSGNDLPFSGVNGPSRILLGLGLTVLIFSIIFFFGYKLYKSIRDKEKKKEDKKKAKQQKKKK